MNQKQFFDQLCENIQSRMHTTQASHISNSTKHVNHLNYIQLLQMLSIFDISTWPEPDDDIDIRFGDQKIKALCNFFNINGNHQLCVDAFREAVHCDRPNIKKQYEHFRKFYGLQPLLNAIDTIVISTAECERSFSQMNDILTPIRNSLSIDTVLDLIFVHNNGLPLTEWDPSNFVRSWLAKGRRSAEELASRKRESVQQKDTFGLWRSCQR